MIDIISQLRLTIPLLCLTNLCQNHLNIYAWRDIQNDQSLCIVKKKKKKKKPSLAFLIKLRSQFVGPNTDIKFNKN